MRHIFKSKRRVFYSCVLLPLIACAPAPEPEIYNPPVATLTGPGRLQDREPDTCKLSDVAYLRGQPASAIGATGLSQPTRIINPGDVVTQEYSANRINFYIDEMGMVGRISCG
ncbi:MAG: I78 family peptidase inhibitor [Pseudorhodobacter sp.]